MDEREVQVTGDDAARLKALNSRLESLAWASFLVALGVLWLLGKERVDDDAWLVAAGAVMLALNGARLVSGIRMSGFSLLLGAVALGAGVAGVLGVKLPLAPVIVIMIGLVIIVRPLFGKKGIAGWCPCATTEDPCCGDESDGDR